MQLTLRVIDIKETTNRKEPKEATSLCHKYNQSWNKLVERGAVVDKMSEWKNVFALEKQCSCL